jgi:DUF1680 family protein
MRSKSSINSQFRLSESPETFWGRYVVKVRQTVIPYQWAALNDRVPGAPPSGAIRNFRIAAGLETGDYVGMVFQDSDVGKWIEAVAYSLQVNPDPELERSVDETIEILEMAQTEDGYLNTYFTIKEPGRRWSNLWECHELYCAGHLLEGAIAYFCATGKQRFLDIMLRYVDLIEQTFGVREGQLRGYDGHEEIELSLLRLYEVTRDERHLQLARFFIDERGQSPAFFHTQWEALERRSHWTGTKVDPPDLSYFQSHLPVREQSKATGHAVRAVYLYTAMAELGRLLDDAELRSACDRLWNNVTYHQMYVTGAIGSTHHGEAFTFDYDLPNETAYAETCAAIGLIFFARRMLEMNPRVEFADTMELALYNAVLPSMSLDGRHFFYENPMESWPAASKGNPERHHVKSERQAWFGCACCPPNVARLLMSLGQYVCHVRERTLFLHHFVTGAVAIPGSETARLELETDYPRGGRIRLQMTGTPPDDFCLALRIPGWCRAFSLKRGGSLLQVQRDGDGYVRLFGKWQTNEVLTLELELSIDVLEAHPQIRANAGKLCIRRGPLIYCLESVDNGANLSALSLDAEATFAVVEERLSTDPPKLLAQGFRRVEEGWGVEAYRVAQSASGTDQPVQIVAVPYYLWGNRGPGEMAIWLRRAERH